MRYLIFMLWISLPCISGAAVSAPVVFRPSLETRPDKTGFLKKIKEKVLTKRIYKTAKTLGRAKGDDGKGLSIIGLTFGLLGISLLIFAVKMEIVALVLVSLLLGLGGLVLCQIGLDRANAMDHPNLGVKAMAYTGLGLNLLLSLVSGGALFIFIAFGHQE